MAERAQKFIDALKTLEATGEVAPIAALFAEGADVSNPMIAHDGAGEPGAAIFWRGYRETFETVTSEFRNVAEAGDVAWLEWISTGKAKGKDIRYGGVSVLEFGVDDAITSFRAYFDPTPLGLTVQSGG